MQEIGRLIQQGHLEEDDLQYCLKKLDEFLAMVIAMRQWQKEAIRLKYSMNVQKRGEVLEREREAERAVDKALSEITEELY